MKCETCLIESENKEEFRKPWEKDGKIQIECKKCARKREQEKRNEWNKLGIGMCVCGKKIKNG